MPTLENLNPHAPFPADRARQIARAFAPRRPWGNWWDYSYTRIKLGSDPLYPGAIAALRHHPAPVLDLGCGLGLFAHQGFSTNIFGMAADIVPAGRVASVIALGAVAGNLAGMGVIELAGWSLSNGFGYTPMFALCGGAYLLALGWIHAVMPRLEAA